MLVIDGSEVTEFEGTLAAGDQRVMLIPISANTQGAVTCRVYLDDALFSEEYITLY